jgi:hypothetical protein
MAETDDPRLTPRRWLAAVLLVGAVLSITQQLAIRDETFVSGDGGIKALVTKQLARGDWHADLRLSAEPWVEALWREGFYPFGPPFVYDLAGRWFIQYPIPFMVVTAPFYSVLGFRGLTIVPLLGLWGLWLAVGLLARRFGLSERASVVALAGLIFCSYTTPYGAMYWEHTLALGLSFLGLVVVLGKRAQDGPPVVDLLGGLLLGVSIWFRPESAVFAAVACLAMIVLGRAPRAWLAAGAGIGLAGLAFAVSNHWIYGSPLGVHAVQQVDPLTAHVAHYPAHVIAGYFGNQLVRYCPVLVVPILVVVAAARWPALRSGREQTALWLLALAFTLGTAIIVPNDGGTQLGARYFLHALPPLFLLLGMAWDRAGSLPPASRRALQLAIAIGLAAGVWLNAVPGTRALYFDYGHRALPALEEIRKDPNEVLVVEHQWMAQDLESLIPQKAVFRVRHQSELEQLARKLREQGQSRFTLVSYTASERSTISAPGLQLRLRPRGQFGTYFIVDCEVGDVGEADEVDDAG